jgi:ribonuclease P protein component
LKFGGVNPLFFQHMVSFTFNKEEKLCSQKIIGEMFLSGNSFLCYPLKVVWLDALDNSFGFPVQAAFSVPKRIFNRAHDRNLIKRRMRETYRYRKNLLYELLELRNRKIGLMIVYIAKEKSEFHQIESAMTKIISRLDRELSEKK